MRLMEEFPSNNSVSVLQDIGVRYLFFHADRFADYAKDYVNIPSDQREEYIQKLGEDKDSSVLEYDAIKKIGVFGQTHIYEILPEPRVLPDNVLITLQNGWYGILELGTRMKNSGRMNAYAPRDGDYNLILTLDPVYGRKEITIFVNGENVGSTALATFPYGFKSALVPIILHQGNNEIIFESDGCVQVWDIPERKIFSDMCVSFTFLDITIEEAMKGD
jgi:hypothetical protein